MSQFDIIQKLGMLDASVLQEKDKSYGSSWRKRGGIGAFMMLARKWDRLESMCAAKGYDIFELIKEHNTLYLDEHGEPNPEADNHILNQLRDLRRYLFLVDSFLLMQESNPYHSEHKPCSPATSGGDTSGHTEDESEMRAYVNQDPVPADHLMPHACLPRSNAPADPYVVFPPKEERVIRDQQQWDNWVAECRKHCRHFEPTAVPLPCIVIFSEEETSWDNPYIEYLVFDRQRLQRMLAILIDTCNAPSKDDRRCCDNPCAPGGCKAE